jgi:hypothetical protein
MLFVGVGFIPTRRGAYDPSVPDYIDFKPILLGREILPGGDKPLHYKNKKFCDYRYLNACEFIPAKPNLNVEKIVPIGNSNKIRKAAFISCLGNGKDS